MRRRITLLALFSALFVSASGPSRAADQHVRLQLKGRPQFEFAGYYMASALGYYSQVGLTVTLKPGGPHTNVADEVASRRADFGIGGADILIQASRTKPFVSLAAIYQHSPVALVVLDKSRIHSPSDLVGARVTRQNNSPGDLEIRTMLKQEGVDPSRVRWAPAESDFVKLTRKEIDAQSTYLANGPFVLKQQGVAYRTIRAQDYGVEFYTDCLFTRSDLIAKDPYLVRRFREASIQGWQWVTDHTDKTISKMIGMGIGLSESDRGRLRFEADQSLRLISARPQKIGYQSPDRWNRMQDYLRALGVMQHTVPIDQFVYDPDVNAADAGLLGGRLHVLYYLLGFVSICLAFYLAYSASLRRGIRLKASQLADTQRELEARGRALHSLIALGHTLAASRYTETLTEEIVHQIRQGTGFDRVGIYLIDESRKQLRGVMGVGTRGEIEDCSRYVFSLDDTDSPIVQVALGVRDYYLTQDAARLIGTEGKTKHNAFVPLRTADHVLGVIAVDNLLTGRPFAESEVRELRGFADEIALAFHNSRLLAHGEAQQVALEHRNRDLSALVAFGELATRARTEDEVVQGIWSTIRNGFGYDRVMIFLRDGDDIRGVLSTDENGAVEPARDLGLDIKWPMRSSRGRWQVLISGQDYVYSPDLTAEEGITTRSGRPIKEHIIVALRTQEQVVGAIAVDNSISQRPIRETDAHSLVAFGRQAATAIQSVTLLEALQSSEEKLRVLVTSLTETLYSARIDDRLHEVTPLYYTPRIALLTGYDHDAALRLPNFWIDRVHPEDRERYRASLADIILGEAKPIEYRIVHRNGDVRWVLDTPTPARDDDGRVVRINGALLDVTERKLLEEGLRRAQKMETVGTLAGGVAHEFNNLLGIILGNIEFARLDAGPDDTVQHSLEQAGKAVGRAADLTKQLLTFSAKIESRRLPVSVQTIVGDTLQLVKSSLGKSIKLEVAPPLLAAKGGDGDGAGAGSELPQVSADAGQIQQVLINLCVNARDAMPDGGSIRISAEQVEVSRDRPNRQREAPTGPYVVISVADTGTGMDARTQERIFEPFFTTKPVGRGTGLGLAVAYGIITEHRGWMEVESRTVEPGRGTTFRIYLPTLGALEGAAGRRPAGAAPTALIVDASPAARESLVDILEGLGYSTLTAATAAEALAIFWTDSDLVDLVVSDSRPAGMDVDQLIANLRDFKPEIPVLIGSPGRNGASPSPNGGAASFVKKPYDRAEIAAAASLKAGKQ